MPLYAPLEDCSDCSTCSASPTCCSGLNCAPQRCYMTALPSPVSQRTRHIYMHSAAWQASCHQRPYLQLRMPVKHAVGVICFRPVGAGREVRRERAWLLNARTTLPFLSITNVSRPGRRPRKSPWQPPTSHLAQLQIDHRIRHLLCMIARRGMALGCYMH